MAEAIDQPRLVQFTPPGYYEAWEMVTSQLRLEMSRSQYEAWVQPMQAVSFKEGVYRVGSINAYGRDWVESRLRTRITRLLEGIFNQPVQVNFVLLKNGEPKPSPVVEKRTTVVEARTGKVRQSHVQELPLAGDWPDDDAPTPAERPAAAKPEPSTGANRAAGAQRSEHAAAAKKKGLPPQEERDDAGGSPRKIQLQRAYGTERARIIQPERGMFLTAYFLNKWLPLLSHSAAWIILAARSLCYWNPMTGELRNVIETDMSELAGRAAVSVRTVKDVLNNDLVKQYFMRYKVRRVMTPNGVRTAGILLQVRMDDPLTPEDQNQYNLPEEERWYTVDFLDEDEE
jgi:hypothetical protein